MKIYFHKHWRAPRLDYLLLFLNTRYILWAAARGNARACKALVEAGVDKSAKGRDGRTAAQLAEIYDQPAVVNYLEYGENDFH